MGFQGQQAGGQGVLNMMEVIEADFVKAEQDTKVAEKRAEQEHEEFMHQTDTDTAAKTKTKEFEQAELVSTESELETLVNSDEPDLANSLKEAQAYYEKLKPSCV